MRDFDRDLFSDHRVRLSEVDRDQAHRLELLWSDHYEHLGVPSAPPEAFGGDAINSRNFIIRTDPSHVLKLLPEGEDSTVDGTARLANWLADDGLPIPRTVTTSRGDLVARHSEGLTCAMTYVDADHFRGNHDELRAAGQIFRQLTDSLDRAPASLTSLPAVKPVGPDEAELLEQLEHTPERWDQWLGEPTAAILGANIDPVREALAEALDDGTTGSPLSICHIDLHPHNILCRDGSIVAVLDIDSLRRADRDVMVAFGALKLLRQGVANAPADQHADESIRTCVQHMRLGLEADGEATPWASWGPLSRAEVTRRIFVLLRLSVEQGNTRWNHVLPVHLRALRESRRLFESNA